MHLHGRGGCAHQGRSCTWADAPISGWQSPWMPVQQHAEYEHAFSQCSRRQLHRHVYFGVADARPTHAQPELLGHSTGKMAGVKHEGCAAHQLIVPEADVVCAICDNVLLIQQGVQQYALLCHRHACRRRMMSRCQMCLWMGLLRL